MLLSDTHIKWIMLVSGALTCTMIYAFIAPQAALTSTFGAALEGPVANVVVRNWGALITLVGAMLIYGALHPPVRSFVLVIAAASKLVFIGLVLSHGAAFLGYQAGIAIAIDSVWVLLFAWYLLTSRRAAL
jgi:hypothetical protein